MASTEVVSCRDLQGRKMSDVLGTLEEAFSSARCVCLQWLLVAVVVVVVSVFEAGLFLLGRGVGGVGK